MSDEVRIDWCMEVPSRKSVEQLLTEAISVLTSVAEKLDRLEERHIQASASNEK